MADFREVLDFWFGPAGSPEHGRPREAWFRKSDAFDDAMRARFPDCNATLGRASTPQEVEFLRQPGSSF